MITSVENKKIKDLIKLRNKKYRDEKNLFLVETKNLVDEAYKNNLLEEIIFVEDKNYDYDVEKIEVSSNVMSKLSLVNSCNIIGVVRKKETNYNFGDKILILDNIQDPGNLGTIIRSCLAFNVDTLVLSLDSCDVYNDKVLRATEGAIFNLNIVRGDIVETILKLKKDGLIVYGTDVNDGEDISFVKEEKYAIILGNEGHGVSDEVKQLVDKNVYIKTSEKTESLNVAVASSILLYELNK